MADCFDPWLTWLRSAEVLAASSAGVQALAATQARRWAALREAALRGSGFHRERLRGANALQDLPAMTKRDLMSHFDAAVTDPRVTLAALRPFLADPARIGASWNGICVAWESSGSQGEPGIFVQDAAAMAVYDALEACRRPPRWRDPWCLGERIVFVGATGGHFASTVTTERLRRLNPALASNLRSVSFLQPTATLVDELNRLAPTIVSTYPTMAVLLAEEKAAGRLRIAPAEAWTGGEMLTASMRGLIERELGCTVMHSYGASEFLPLASPCRFGALHLNSDWVILEPVDERGRPVPAGVMGSTTLLTNLANHLQPLIRYDLGDRVMLHCERCACGSPLPAIDVEGRCDDMIVLPGTHGEVVRVLPLALTTVLEDDAAVFDFQLVQTGPATLRLSVAGDRAEATRAGKALRAYLRAHGAASVRLATVGGTTHRRGATGKLQRVVAAAR